MYSLHNHSLLKITLSKHIKLGLHGMRRKILSVAHIHILISEQDHENHGTTVLILYNVS